MIESISGREFSVSVSLKTVEICEGLGSEWATYLSPSEARKMAMDLIIAANAAEEAS